MSAERVRARTRVPASRERAFQIFVDDVDGWWRRGPRFRFAGGDGGTLRFEARLGGRFLEARPAGGPLEVGRIVAWDPPRSFAFRLHAPAPGGGEGSTVEVSFTEVDRGTTEVRLEHRGFSALPATPGGGLRGTALRNALAVFWADVLNGLR